jgi:hypothetical protein
MLIAGETDSVFINERFDNQFVIPLQSLAPWCRVLKPIWITVEGWDEEGYSACWPEGNIGMSGVTGHEAIDGLKHHLVSYFNRLMQTPDDELGCGPLAQKRIMAEYIEPAV